MPILLSDFRLPLCIFNVVFRTSEPSGLVLAYFDDMIHSEGSVGNRGRLMLINENLYIDSELSFSSFLNHVYITQLSAANNHSECHFFFQGAASL